MVLISECQNCRLWAFSSNLGQPWQRVRNLRNPVTDTSQPLLFLPSLFHLAGETAQFSIFNASASQDSLSKWLTAPSGFRWHLNHQRKGLSPCLFYVSKD